MDSPIRPPIKISAPRSRQWSLIAWLSAAECFMRAMWAWTATASGPRPGAPAGRSWADHRRP